MDVPPDTPLLTPATIHDAITDDDEDEIEIVPAGIPPVPISEDDATDTLSIPDTLPTMDTTDSISEFTPEPTPRLTRELAGLRTNYNPAPIPMTREIQNLTTFYNPDPTAHSREDAHFALIVAQNDYSYAMAAIGQADYNPAPSNYRDAMNRKDAPCWWRGMCVEFDNIHDKTVWRIVKRTDVPSGRKIIGNRWVYTLKDDGTHRARTVAQGFSQTPGQDFHENHAPVVHDTTFRFCLAQQILYRLSSGQFDVVTAFLYGFLEEIIYMVFPSGYDRYLKEFHNKTYSPEEYCLLLEKALYGLVQAARQWWKKLTEIMKKLGFFPSTADPCLFIKPSTKDQPPVFL
jgi:hypothetical protein